MMEQDPESAHDVKSRIAQEQPKPNRKIRRMEQKYTAKDAIKKANDAKKSKAPTKSEMIAIVRERQGLPPLEPKKKEIIEVIEIVEAATVEEVKVATEEKTIVVEEAKEDLKVENEAQEQQ